MKQVIHMLPPDGPVPQSIELDPADEFQITRLMVSGYRQVEPPSEVKKTAAPAGKEK